MPAPSALRHHVARRSVCLGPYGTGLNARSTKSRWCSAHSRQPDRRGSKRPCSCRARPPGSRRYRPKDNADYGILLQTGGSWIPTRQDSGRLPGPASPFSETCKHPAGKGVIPGSGTPLFRRRTGTQMLCCVDCRRPRDAGPFFRTAILPQPEGCASVLTRLTRLLRRRRRNLRSEKRASTQRPS